MCKYLLEFIFLASTCHYLRYGGNMEINIKDVWDKKQSKLDKDLLKESCLFMVYESGKDPNEEFDMDIERFKILCKAYGVDLQVAQMYTSKDKIVNYIKGLSVDSSVNGIVIGKSWANNPDLGDDILVELKWMKDVGGISGTSRALLNRNYRTHVPYQICSCMDLLEAPMKMMDALIIGKLNSLLYSPLRLLIERNLGTVTFVHEETSLATVFRRMHDSDAIIILDDILEDQLSYQDVSNRGGWCLETLLSLVKDKIDVDSFELTNIMVSNDVWKLNELNLLSNLADAIDIMKVGEPE